MLALDVALAAASALVLNGHASLVGKAAIAVGHAINTTNRFKERDTRVWSWTANARVVAFGTGRRRRDVTPLVVGTSSLREATAAGVDGLLTWAVVHNGNARVTGFARVVVGSAIFAANKVNHSGAEDWAWPVFDAEAGADLDAKVIAVAAWREANFVGIAALTEGTIGIGEA